jgi:ribosomal protein L16 Arg81 hydroxylase
MNNSQTVSIDHFTQEAVSNESSELDLVTASATGDLDVVQKILSQNHYIPRETFCPALATAVTNNQVTTVTYLLDHDVPMNQGLFLSATELKYYQILQVFLDHSWDINTPVDALRPPALALVNRTCSKETESSNKVD